ncbi:hypothetical protein Bhyg_10153 [Pseudolycoriella hygida]|uniref:Uncharacterized protein n=1 Tax=Pseudolycoriella hygida TaxID=35572 RepID=A0A9Q0RYY9_9DIPT|nr:hypothetical protein Bhyg_10153 [Pseudolycoriella hygida]
MSPLYTTVTTFRFPFGSFDRTLHRMYNIHSTQNK